MKSLVPKREWRFKSVAPLEASAVFLSIIRDSMSGSLVEEEEEEEEGIRA